MFLYEAPIHPPLGKLSKSARKKDTTSPPWKTRSDLLDQPTVSIWIAEGNETIVGLPIGIKTGSYAFRAEVERFANVHSAFRKFSARCLDIGSNQISFLICSGLRIGDPVADMNRAL